MSNARIQFSIADESKWNDINPTLREGELALAKKASGKYILKVGAPGGSTYKNATVVWDQDSAEQLTADAENAAQSAEESADAAAGSASEAASSASAASTSAANAGKSATAAASSQSAAAGSASAAASSATTASNSATTATTKAGEAASSATAAASSASTATTKANEAASSANTATTKANDATDAATDASGYAQAAADSASAASTSAGEAADSATEAADSATAAAESAGDAAASAQTAADIAENLDDPVSNIDENGGTVTINKTKGSVKTFEVLTPTHATLSGSPDKNADNHDVPDTSWVRRTIEDMAETLAPDPVMSRKIEKDGSAVKLWWRDPADGTADGVIISRWAKTVIVKKQGGYPETPTDGTVVITNATRNQYADEPYVDTQENPASWYYRAFPCSSGGLYSTSELNRFGFWHYGIYIDEPDPDENTCVHNLPGFDNHFYDRPFMDFDSDEFYWAEWKNSQILPKPCMLKSDGVVDYYLDPDDYTKKADGTASDVTDVNYNGNAMMEWLPVYTMVERVGNKLYMYFCSEKYNDSYECYSCKKSDGSYGDHFYMPIYEGWFDSNGKMRSMSTGQKPTVNKTAEAEAAAATLNGSGWNTTLWADEQLLQMLGILFFGRLNLQVACGYNPGSSTSAITHVNGTANTKGMFYGHASTNAVGTKFFGMENWWGHRWRRPNGLMTDGYRVKVKLTNSTIDGSTATGYNRTGDGYIDTGVDVPGGMSQSYIKKISGDPRCATAPIIASGASSTTYYCDAAWSASGLRQLFLGGSVADGAAAGLFAFNVRHAPGSASWYLGASLSYKNF